MSIRDDIKGIRVAVENIEELLAELVGNKRELADIYAALPKEEQVVAFSPRDEVRKVRLRRAEREARLKYGVRGE